MYTFRSMLAVLLVLYFLPLNASATELLSSGLGAELPRLGKSLSPQQLEQLPEHVFADGSGLPNGEGSVARGAKLYTDLCAHCHGSAGQGGRAMELIGDRSLLNSDYPDRGIAVYWPYAPTLFEYVYRSMPPDKPASLAPDDLYALIAYLLQINGLWNDNDILDKNALAKIAMPNVAGFHTIGR